MEPNPPPQSPPQTRTATIAIWSLVLGILSLTCFWILAAIPAVICGHIASSRIKQSGGLLTGSGLAVAGLVTGYVSIAMSLFILPMMLAIAIPNFVKARETAQRNACVSNLNQINGAIQTWALENKKEADSIVTFDNIKPYLKHHLVCPNGGTYRLERVKDKPTCSIPGHALPADSEN